MTETTYSITELAREFQMTPRAIRYYEDHGLLAPERKGMQRVYSKRDRTRLKLTLRGKRLGLSLAEIRELINMYDTTADESACPPGRKATTHCRGRRRRRAGR